MQRNIIFVIRKLGESTMEEHERRWEHCEDLPEDMEKEMMENMSTFFVRKDLGLLAQIILESAEPLVKMFATLGMGMFGPYLEFLEIDTYVSFFRKEGNTRVLLDRIEELEHQRKKWEKKVVRKEK